MPSEPLTFDLVTTKGPVSSVYTEDIEQRGKSDRKKWWFSKGNPLISGKSRLVKYYNLARWGVLQFSWTQLFNITPSSLDESWMNPSV